MKTSGVTFPNRRHGLVHVHGRLQLPSGTPHLDVSFRRERLAMALRAAPQSSHLVQLALSVCVLLSRTSAHLDRRGARPIPSELKRRRLTLHGFYEDDLETGQPSFPYTISISRSDMLLVAHEFARSQWNAQRVSTEIQILFMDPALRDVAAGRAGRRPRGARANASDLLRPVRWALLEAEQLCKVAQADATVRMRVEGVLGDEFDATRWRQNAILLVNRAFQPAWARYGVKSLEARTEGDAGDVYKTLLPAAGRRALLATFEQANALQKDPARAVAAVHEKWEGRLLGPEGQAARDFDLV